MKFNKNDLQVIALVIATFSIIFTIFTDFPQLETSYTNKVVLLTLATSLVSMLLILYFLLIIRRINPKQYIYISYMRLDKDIAQSISQTLREQFKKLSKYRFEIITADSISYGEDIYMTMQEFIRRSSMVIIVVSSNYICSEWCSKELLAIKEMNKKIIPIVMESYNDLSKLPVDLSNIKALSLRDCSSEKDFDRQLLCLAEDLIRQRKN